MVAVAVTVGVQEPKGVSVRVGVRVGVSVMVSVASAKKPWPTIVEGAAHEAGFVKVEGWLFVKDKATAERHRLSRFPQRVSIPIVYNTLRPRKNFRTIG